ncbi:MAG: serine/threonine protein kinase [Pirellulales bacterium]|nr:serine/threonine protein kinase [Pirellulales bacterium]
MPTLQDEFGGKPLSARGLSDELVKREILTRWQADMLLKGKHRGFRLGPHRILKPLGQGGMSKVFLAEHEMMRRRCAIKVLPSKYQSDPDLLARFHIEARAIAALDHPHIVRAYDFNRDVRYGKEIHYLVMEYVDGPDLRRLVEEQGPLDYRKAADFIAQAADGLAHAHQAGFVHRDIKPANLLVDPNGVLKILDLGLARVTFEGERPWQTAEGEPSAVGTADYVAPEQVADSRNVDGRADIYSLGHTFYFLLTGRRPFPKSTLVELLMAHRKEQPEPVGKFRPDVPYELIEFIERMTAKEPIRRFQTAREVADKLQAWLEASAEGGDYSRISALMAAAMRSKQPSDQETARKPGTKETEASVLELAALEDEPTPPNSDGVEGKKTEQAKPSVAKEKPSHVKKHPHGDSKPSLANLRADVLAELLPSDTVAASQSDPLMTLPPDEGRLPYQIMPRFKRSGGIKAVLKSPWFWTSLIWVFALLILLVLLLRSSPPEPPREQTPGEISILDDSEPLIELSTTLPGVLSPPLESDAESSETHLPTPEDQPSAETPPRPVEEPAPEPPPQEEPAPDPSPAAPGAPQPKAEDPRPNPTKPSAERKPGPNELLAGVKKMFLLIQSNQNPNSTINLTIKRQALDALKELDIEVEELPASNRLDADFDEKDPTKMVMLLQIKVSKSADMFSVVLTGGAGRPVSKVKLAAVWHRTESVVSLPTTRPRQDQVLRMLRIGAKEYFDQFVDKVRKARVEAKFN